MQDLWLPIALLSTAPSEHGSLVAQVGPQRTADKCRPQRSVPPNNESLALTTNMDGHSDLRPVHFECRRQKAKAAEFISVDLYHHPSNAIVHRESRRIYFGGSLPLPYY